jgi:hypothetical protein
MSDLPMFNSDPQPDLRAVQVPEDETVHIPCGVFKRFVKQVEAFMKDYTTLADQMIHLTTRLLAVELDVQRQKERINFLEQVNASQGLGAPPVSERSLGNRLMTLDEVAAQVYNQAFDKDYCWVGNRLMTLDEVAAQVYNQAFDKDYC